MAEIKLDGGPLRFPDEEIWRYPWDLWTDGQPWELTVGTDIPGIRRFRAAASKWGTRHDLTIVTRRRGTDKLVLQALKGMPR